VFFANEWRGILWYVGFNGYSLSFRALEGGFASLMSKFIFRAQLPNKLKRLSKVGFLRMKWFFWLHDYQLCLILIEPAVPAGLPTPVPSVPVGETQASSTLVDPVVQQQMVASFSEQSGMNMTWSLKYLDFPLFTPNRIRDHVFEIFVGVWKKMVGFSIVPPLFSPSLKPPIRSRQKRSSNSTGIITSVNFLSWIFLWSVGIK